MAGLSLLNASLITMPELSTPSIDLVNLADVVFTVLLGIVGLYLVHSLRRQQALRVAEKRLAAYQALWGRMALASPVRLTVWNAKPLSVEERQQLFHSFTDWYYENGNGMFMGDSTRAIYLKAKDNLLRDVDYYEPRSIRQKLLALPPAEQDRARGYLSIRQLSLLRNRMKADLGVFGIPYHVNLNELDVDFLIACGENLNSSPWNKKTRPTGYEDQGVAIFPAEE